MTNTSAFTSITDALDDFAAQFDRRMQEVLDADSRACARLLSSMRYSLLSSGKRIRPFVLERCYRVAGGRGPEVLPAALAVECLHTFTLIHDDLPAMDDDQVRRGQPCNHLVYGEALAILAGNALLALGFELLSQLTLEREIVLGIIQEMTRAIGRAGVIGGQAEEIIREDETPSIEVLRKIHLQKTARLFQSCCRIGAMAAGANDTTFKKLDDYGRHLGLAFQIADDLLDIPPEPSWQAPKNRKTAPRNKQSFPHAVGIEESRRLGAREVEQARVALSGFGPEADDLRRLAHYVLGRNR